MKERNVVKTRCSSFGNMCQVAFWVWAAFCLITLMNSIWIASHDESFFTAYIEESSVGVVGKVEFSGNKEGSFAEMMNKERIFDVGEVSMAVAECPKAAYLTECFGYVPISLIGGVILWLFRKIFRNIAHDESPFTKKNSRAIFWIGILFGVGAYFKESGVPIIRFLVGYAAGGLDPVELLFYYGIGPFLVWSSPLIALSYIFDYGTALQQESDETL